MLRIIRLVGALCLTVAATGAAAASFDYKINGYPKDAGDCHQLADAFGPAFAKAAGVAVTRSVCTTINDFGYNITITYTADAELDPVSTLDESGGPDDRGAFATDADCRTQLAIETQHFQAVTGLAPFVSYCFNDAFDEDFPYAIRIESFGKPAMTPFVNAAVVFGLPIDATNDDVEQSLLAGLKARGVDASYVRYKDGDGDGIIDYYYYGATRTLVGAAELGSLQSADQCAAEKAQLASAVTGLAKPPLFTYCSSDSILDDFLLVSLVIKDAGLTFEQAAEQYDSYDECATARSAQIETYKVTYNRPVVGAVCGYQPRIGDNVWRLNLIENQ